MNHKKAISFLFLIILLTSCIDFKLNSKTFNVYPKEDDNLKVLNKEDIEKLISQPSVGEIEEMGDKKYFVPINFSARIQKIGPYNVRVGDLIITKKANKFKPIRFEKEGITSNSFLFFLPSKDSTAISREKLKAQFEFIDYIDKNSIISKNIVIHYNYNHNKKGFEVFHSQRLTVAFEDLTSNERLYQSIDILRMAKHLKDTTASQLDWKKIDMVTPIYLPRYFNDEFLDTIAEITKAQPKNFKCDFESVSLNVKLSTIKDSSLVTLLKDLNRTPLKKLYPIQNNYSKESIRIFSEYLDLTKSEIFISKKEKNTFYLTNDYSQIVLFFLPKRKLLLVIDDGDPYEDYNDKIYFSYFKKKLIPKLKKKRKKKKLS